MEEIIPIIRQGVSQLEKERYLNTYVETTHSINFFDDYNRDTSLIQLSHASFVDCKIEDPNRDVLKISMSNENLEILVDQFASKAKELMCSQNLVNSDHIANQIIEKIGREKCDPDEIPEFKHYIEGHGNGVKSYFEFYIHPITIITAIPNVITQTIVRRCVTKKRDIININRFYNLMYANVLVHKQMIYRSYLKSMLITYSELKSVFDTKSGCTFKYDFCGISNVCQIKPKDSLGNLYDCLLRMSQVLKDGTNNVSFDVFQAINFIYNEFIAECRQRKISRVGIEALKECRAGSNIDSILDALVHTQISSSIEDSKELIECKAQILAVSIMRSALNGRGMYSNQNFPLFGLMTSPNASSKKGICRVYEKTNIESVNKRVNTYLADVISQIEMMPSSEIGDFSRSNFVQTVSTYNRNVIQDFEESKTQFEEAFEQSINELKDAIPSEPIPKRFNEKLKYIAEIVSKGIKPTIAVVKKYKLLMKIKNKFDKMQMYFNLIIWYNTTTSLLQNEQCIGVVVKNYSSTKCDISPIIIQIA